MLDALKRQVIDLELQLDALKLQVKAVELKLETRIAAEELKREQEIEALHQQIEALREEWRNLAQAITANSTALANATSRVLGELGEVKAEQKHQSDQLRLIGQGMEILLKDHNA